MTRRFATTVLILLLLLAPTPARATTTRYQLTYTTTTHSDLRALFGMPISSPGAGGLVHDIDNRLEAELERSLLEVDGERLLALRLRAPQVALRIDAATADGAAVARQLASGPLLATLDADGLVTGLRFPPGMDEQGKAYARALVGALQFSRPRQGAKSWETREDDQAGSYRARYERSGNSVVRTRIAYDPVRARMPGDVQVAQLITPAGKVRARFARAGELLSLDGAETQQVSVAGKTIATGSLSVQLKRLAGRRLGEPARKFLVQAARAHRQAPERLSIAAQADSSDESMHRRELGTDTLETLLARLHGQAADPSGSIAATSLYLKFKALVALQPDVSDRLGQELTRAPAGGAKMLTLAQALGVIGHPPAQDALVAALRHHRHDWPAMASLLPVLGSVSDPTDASIEVLQEIARTATQATTASTARLALGTLARTSTPSMPARAAGIVEWLRARLAESVGERDRRDYLLALGNTTSAAAEAEALRFARDPAPDVRSAALAALRWIQSARARAQLLSSLASDEDPEVRRAAAHALAALPMNSASHQAHRRAFATDPDDQVRVAVLYNLWSAVADYPEVHRLVEAARNDPSKAVRDTAARMH